MALLGLWPCSVAAALLLVWLFARTREADLRRVELGSIAPCSGQRSLEDQPLELLAGVGGVLLDLNRGRLQL